LQEKSNTSSEWKTVKTYNHYDYSNLLGYDTNFIIHLLIIREKKDILTEQILQFGQVKVEMEIQEVI